MSGENQQELDKWKETRAIHKEFHSFYKLLGGLIIVVFLIAIGSSLFRGDNLPGYWANIYVTMVGTAFTIFVIDERAKDRAKRQRKMELVAQIDSPSNDFAVEAARLLTKDKSHYDGSLRDKRYQNANLEKAVLPGADFRGSYFEKANFRESELMLANFENARFDQANFQKANLNHAQMAGINLRTMVKNEEYADFSEASLIRVDFQEADLSFTNFYLANLFEANMRDAKVGNASLKQTNLMNANLQGADLNNSDLEDADVRGANFMRANLESANLKNTFLQDANLKGAILVNADLTGAYLSQTGGIFADTTINILFDSNTILPNRENWTNETDVTQFTDSNHPNYWHPPAKISILAD